MLQCTPTRLPALAAICTAVLVAPAQAARQNEDHTCGNTRIDVGLVDVLYNAINDNGEGRIGPRRLVVNQSGMIVSRGTRLFVQSTPMDISQASIRIVKTDGRARTTVAICSTTEGGHQNVLKEFEIPNGTGNVGDTFKRALNGIKGRRLSVYFKGKSLTNTMSYKLFLERPTTGDVWEPTQEQLDAPRQTLPGFADLHAHHAGRWAFGGAWYWGEMGEGELAADPASHSRELAVKVAGLSLKVLRPAHERLVWPTWSDSSHQQMGYDALREAYDGGLRLMIAPAVNSEWLCAVLTVAGEKDPEFECSDMESAKLQLLRMKEFAADNEWYRIVTNPWEAHEAIEKGQLAVILAVEVSNLFPTSDGDWRRQLDELYDMGVRLVYIAHETNSRFAGAAYHHTEDLKLPNQLKAWFSSEIEYASNGEGTRNAIGLTDLGNDLVDELIERHMLIDVDHISQLGVEQLFKITSGAQFYPIFAGHTRLSTLLPPRLRAVIPELNTTPETAEQIRISGGMVGLRTGPDPIRTFTPSGVANDCDGSVKSLIQTYRAFENRDLQVAFGSDFNGFVSMTAPRFGADACPAALPRFRERQQSQQVAVDPAGAPTSWSRYLERGMSDIGTEPSVIFDMKALGVDTGSIENSAEVFIKAWTRAYDPNRGQVG